MRLPWPPFLLIFAFLLVAAKDSDKCITDKDVILKKLQPLRPGEIDIWDDSIPQKNKSWCQIKLKFPPSCRTRKDAEKIKIEGLTKAQTDAIIGQDLGYTSNFLLWTSARELLVDYGTDGTNTDLYRTVKILAHGNWSEIKNRSSPSIYFNRTKNFYEYMSCPLFLREDVADKLEADPNCMEADMKTLRRSVTGKNGQVKGCRIQEELWKGTRKDLPIRPQWNPFTNTTILSDSETSTAPAPTDPPADPPSNNPPPPVQTTPAPAETGGNGANFRGVSGSKNSAGGSSSAEDEGFPVWAVAILVIGGLLIVAVPIIVIVSRSQKAKKRRGEHVVAEESRLRKKRRKHRKEKSQKTTQATTSQATGGETGGTPKSGTTPISETTPGTPKSTEAGTPKSNKEQSTDTLA